MTHDEKILRELAHEYAAAANSARNAQARLLHITSNDLHMQRPIVLVDEIPWQQMNFDDSLTCVCEDNDFRAVEWFLRAQLFKWRNIPSDQVLQPFIGVPKVIHSTGIGITCQEETLHSTHATDIISHSFVDQLEDEDSPNIITPPVLTYNEAATQASYTKIGTVLGDILPVRITGMSSLYLASWDDIARYRGVMPILIDLADRPEHSHAIIEKITQCKVAELDQREALGALDREGYGLHCTPSLTQDLPAVDGQHATRAHIWGRGMAQIFGSVSRDMHQAFDLEYQKRTVGTCGLVYYGCCEPLHTKIDLLEATFGAKLRKIGVTPWADVNISAEVIGNKYVFSSKPNPAAVAVPSLDEAALRSELGEILQACKRNDVKGLDITLKDISTVNGNPRNLIRWAEIAMEMTQNY